MTTNHTARLLVMETNNSAVFTVLLRSVGHGQKFNPRWTLKKIWEGFLFKPGEWL